MLIQIALIYDTTTAKSMSITNAGTVYAQTEHQNQSINKAILYLETDTEPNKNLVNQVLQTAKIEVNPTILFVEELNAQGDKKIITRLTGKNLSVATIQRIYLQVLNGQIGESDSTGNDPEADTAILAGDGDGGFGLGGPGFNFDFGNFAWLLLAVYTGKQALDSTTSLGQAGYAGLAAYSANKALEFKL